MMFIGYGAEWRTPLHWNKTKSRGVVRVVMFEFRELVSFYIQLHKGYQLLPGMICFQGNLIRSIDT